MTKGGNSPHETQRRTLAVEVGGGDGFNVAPRALGFQGVEGLHGFRASGNHLGGELMLIQKSEANQGSFMLADGGVEFLA